MRFRHICSIHEPDGTTVLNYALANVRQLSEREAAQQGHYEQVQGLARYEVLMRYVPHISSDMYLLVKNRRGEGVKKLNINGPPRDVDDGGKLLQINATYREPDRES